MKKTISALYPDIPSPKTVRSPALVQLAVASAALDWAALAVELWLMVDPEIGQRRSFAMALVLYLGFFTIWTNLLAAIGLSIWAAGPNFPGYRLVANPISMTTIASALVMAGMMYTLDFLISPHPWLPLGTEFVADFVLHYVMPVLMGLFWTWVVPARSLSWWDAPWLLVYPLSYLVYVFGRGEILRVYPYDCFDVLKLGYPSVLLNAVILLVIYILIMSLAIVMKTLPISNTSNKQQSDL